ncbi:MAG: glycosyltransferase, partial [Planctomycetota bacterium]
RVPRVMLTLANALTARGHRVDLVVARPDGPLRAEVSPRMRLVALAGWLPPPPWVARKRSRQVVMGIPLLARYLRRVRPDVLLSADHYVNFSALLARAIAGVGTRVAVSQHMPLSWHAGHKPVLRWLVRHLYPRADAVIAVSNGVADDLAQTAGLPRHGITTIYNPVVTAELEEKAHAPLDHPWFAPGSPPVVLGVGRLVSQKDFAVLLKAFARARGARPARLVILGEGPGRESLTALAAKLGVAGDLALPGFVANPFAYMARASVFVLASAWEGLPTVLIEALGCGCPVVSTDCPSGPAEILAGGKYGPLVPVGDDVALAAAILRLLGAPPDASMLRGRAALFSVDRSVREYLAVLTGDPDGRNPAE